MNRRNLKLSILLLFVLGIGARAQAPAPNVADDTTGTISGQVVSDSGQPLAGASLYVRAINSINGPRSATTDADGNFRLNGLEPALYVISAMAPAYASEFSVTPTYYRLGDSVRLELVRGAVITGTVTNSAGEPVIGVRIRVVRIRDAKGQASRQPALGGDRQTDDRGVYRIYGLLPGTYLISAGGGGSFTSVFNPYDADVPTYSPSSTRDNASEIALRSGEEMTADIRYRGEPGYSISGTVRVTGTSGASVTLRSAGNPILLGSAFQQAGIGRGFAFNGLADGEYTLRAQEVVSGFSTDVSQLATSVTKRITIKGASVSGLELVPTPLAAIRGRVLLVPSKITECQGKRAPLFAEMMVQLQRPEKEIQDEDGIYVGPSGGSAGPDLNGSLMWRNVRPGKYRFEPRFYARYWYLQSITTKTAGPKAQTTDAAANWTGVKAGEQLSNVTITLAEGAASIRGRVAVVQPGMSLYLIPAEPDKGTDALRFFVTEVATDGTFTLTNLPPGRYLALTQTNADTLVKLRDPEGAEARAKLRRTAETKKTELELKPCQNLTDYQLKQ
jgi:protocatechuate 3,4-dioxygenase beta subunit